ncbi:MAG: acyl-CoA dehydrogenase family protein, partial [Sphingomonadaceae bacterium]|nr:acyl-CoA dehydrogenase family protein [Sphingomonadaceae bacterium]
MLDMSRRFAYTEEHHMFRDTVRKVFGQHLAPFLDEHEKNGIVPREVWQEVGA